MRLATIRVQNLGRFRGKHSIEARGRVTCLVGPNESGKSTIIAALQMVNSEFPWIDSMRTRGADGESFVEVDFELEDSDRILLADVDPEQQTAWWTIRRDSSGVSARAYPPLKRVLDTRHGLGTALARLHKSDHIERFQAAAGKVVDVEYRKTIEALSSGAENLSAQQLESVRGFSSLILDNFVRQGEPISDEMKTLLERLRGSVEPPHPNTSLESRLLQLCPQFVVFSEEQRELYSRYVLRDLATSVPPAVRSLSSVAGLDLAELADAVEKNDLTRRRALIRSANQKLERALEHSWEGRRFIPDVEVADGTFMVHLRNTTEEMTVVEERSEGLRFFLSLKLFLLSDECRAGAVVLVDEVERHLHYDAQATVVELLYGLRSISGVLYSTHSIGSLPRDLGSGIAVASPIEASDDSAIIGSIWSNGVSGMNTLLISMGAGLVSLLPSRFVLVVEGDCDAILYPRLFREVLGCSDLAFKIVPGLASLEPRLYSDIQADAGRIAFLVDGDESGMNYVAQLVEAGVTRESIFCLGSIADSLVLEDLVSVTSYRAAVNRVFGLYGKSSMIPDSALSRPNRPEQLNAWCFEQGLSAPQKRQVAVYLAEGEGALGTGECEGIVDPELVDRFATVAHAVRAWLQ